MLTQYVIALLSTAFALFVLSLFVYFRDKKNRLNRTYAFFTLSAFLWSFGEALLIISPTQEIAIFWNYICNFGIFFIATGYIHFILSFLGIDHENSKRKVIIISYIFSFLATGLLFTKLFLPTPIPKFYLNYFINPGPIIYFSFVVFWLCQVVYGLYQLFKAYIVSSGTRRNQLKYLLIGTLIGFVGGSGNYFLTFNIEIFPINPFGTYGVVIFAVMMTYAILKYRLMDIRVAFTRAGIFVIVYILVLGIPLGLTGWGRYWLQELFGANWYWAPVVLAIILASAGPFIYQYLRRHAEDVLLREQRRYQRALRDISKTMSRIRDLDKLLHAIVLTVVEQVKVGFAGIYLKDEERKTYSLKRCVPAKLKSSLPEYLSVDDPLIGLLAGAKIPLLREEIGPQNKFGPDLGLVVPCFIEDALLGFLVLGPKPNNQIYTPDDVLAFETLSYSASLAIENSQFWREIEDRQRKARLQEMDTYSYSLAHEIDNPMQVVIGQSNLLKKFLLGECALSQEKHKEVSESFDFILEAARRVSAMVKAIRDFGSKTTGELAPLDIEDVVTAFAKLYYPQFKANSVAFERTSLLKEPVFVLGEKPELMQVLVIFADNSVHALLGAPKGEAKRVSLETGLSSPERVRIRFSDNGYGIKEGMSEAIFKPFVTTKASTEGTGMGLHNAVKIIEKYKGRIWAESDGPGKGAALFIELPIAKGVTKANFKKEDNDKRVF